MSSTRGPTPPMHPDFDLSSQIRRFEDQYARNPGSLIFARLADLHRKAGSARRALEVLDEGLERHPEYLSAHIVRARTLQTLDRTEEAETAYHRVLALDRQNLVALRALAELARERGDLSEARDRYERLLQVDPRNDRARARLRELPGSEAPSGPTARPGPGPGGRVEPAEDREELADEVRRIVADVRERFGERGEEGAKAPDASEERRASEEARDAGEGPDVPEATSDVGATGDEQADDTDDTEHAEEAGDSEDLAVAAVAGSENAAPVEDESSLPTDDERPPAVEDERPAPPEDASEDEGLVTETLAQLYASQGFHEEAVQMYEEMARERPDDPDLRARLEAVRARARGEEPEEPPPPLERAGRRRDEGEVEDGSGGGGRGSRDGRPLSETGQVDGDGRPARIGATSPIPAEAPTPTARQHLRALLRDEAIPGYANQLLRESRGEPDGED